MADYYSDRLSADRLRRVYEIATPRIVRYLDAEIGYVKEKIRPTDKVLDLGCGYGRVLNDLADCCNSVVGIDKAQSSLLLAREMPLNPTVHLAQMDAVALGFRDRSFDVVVCIQNGISAFKIEPERLLAECMRVTKRGGRVLLSSYSDKIWDDRLEWFKLQSAAGLLGDIDQDAAGNGVIVCKDGFQATTFTRQDFRSLSARICANLRIEEVDNSSLFCEIVVG
ncbi:MAG: class I SAM-dependent methyltransferase [candidate division Zixibacteria bacterium]|nr:class I SAM-dependent methyltransferase [candidate division Zixibacteria bacterium]MBU1470452.1 class I SAM-dependent methyltransferase [candidate division Zixibacteria bacterium]MBU2625901.1 class I SAM-dependent methyltransferase [candidate division Zixibacteria bacterium]